MIDEIMTGIQGPPGALEFNTEDSREKAQEAQDRKSAFATLRGYSFGSQFSRLPAFQAVKFSPPSVAAEVKLGQTKSNRSAGQSGRQIVCKYIAMNDLQTTTAPASQAQSNWIKPVQGSQSQLQSQSARGLAHSKTLRAFRQSSENAQRPGLRRPFAAFPQRRIK